MAIKERAIAGDSAASSRPRSTATSAARLAISASSAQPGPCRARSRNQLMADLADPQAEGIAVVERPEEHVDQVHDDQQPHRRCQLGSVQRPQSR